MSGPNPPVMTPGARVRVMQIVAGALIAGSTFLMGLALVLVSQNGPLSAPRGDLPFPPVTGVALLMLAVNVPLSFLLPAQILQPRLKAMAQAPAGPPDLPEGLLPVRQTALIVGMALLEGASFIGSIAYLLEGTPLALVGAGLPILLMLLRFPTQSSTQSWLEAQREKIAALRHGV